MAKLGKLGVMAGSLCMAFSMVCAGSQAQTRRAPKVTPVTHIHNPPKPSTPQKTSPPSAKKHHDRISAAASASESYIVIDGTTGRVLAEKNADALHYPASTTKILTTMCVWDAIRAKKLSLDSMITISAHAAGRQNSYLDRLLKPGTKISVREALGLVTVASSNDLAAALGEAVAGSEDAFAEVMNRKAAALGMNRSHFVNASGLPDDRQVTTAADMARLVETVLTEYKDLMPFFALKSATYGGVTYINHNHLLSGTRPYAGMDFGKTGYFRRAGSNLAASAEKGGERVLAIILRAPTAAKRDTDMRHLLDHGFDILSAPKTPENTAPLPKAS